VNSQGFRQIRKHRNNTSLLISDPGNSALHVLRISPTSCAHRRRDPGIHHRRAGAPHRPEPDRVLATVMFAYIVNSIERAAKMGDQRWGRTARKTRSWIRIGSKPQHWKERAGSSGQRSSESPIQPVWSVRFWARSASLSSERCLRISRFCASSSRSLSESASRGSVTLIVQAINTEQAIQISDRRFTSSRGVETEEGNKAATLIVEDGRFAVGFAGLAVHPRSIRRSGCLELSR
jgi:hypothetical protein